MGTRHMGAALGPLRLEAAWAIWGCSWIRFRPQGTNSRVTSLRVGLWGPLGTGHTRAAMVGQLELWWV